MALLLNIETSTSVCSVALARDGQIISLKENKEGMNHATLLTVFIENILKENELSPSDLDAVAISMGPGSYTGLRIGVSTAKGICFGANIPLIAINTLEAMAYPIAKMEKVQNLLKNPETAWYCPMIDARRMEVYTAFFDGKNQLMKETSADIIDETSYLSTLDQRELIFFGDGSAKCNGTISHSNAHFLEEITPSAVNMAELAEEKFKENKFEDVAYFEPFYLKDFVATVPKKNILG
ncbi:MAG: tRNA (adenosine(37)-N6)-threonylcarbamoyltransferase complex dimerization subunit type 1 TsaB [Marinifilaceae bacterium]